MKVENVDLTDLTNKIAGCHCCTKGVIDVENKICMRYRTHTDWRPKKVEILFIAESPYREDTYFYGEKSILRGNLFNILGIADKPDFKKRGFFQHS